VVFSVTIGFKDWTPTTRQPECQTAAVARRQEFLDAAGVKTLDRDELQATLRVFHDRGNREWRVAERLGFQSPRQACQRFLALLPASSLG
jgi:hypothetical protein